MKDDGLVTVDDDNHITLTETGKAVAEQIYERHKLLSELLIHIGVSKETALKDACKIEHDISEETFEALKNFAAESGIIINK